MQGKVERRGGVLQGPSVPVPVPVPVPHGAGGAGIDAGHYPSNCVGDEVGSWLPTESTRKD